MRVSRPKRWMPGYLARHAIQKVLGAAPYGFAAQVLAKRVTGRFDRFRSEGAILRTARAKIARFNATAIAPPETVVEQGTGALGLDLVLFHLAGARRIFTYDTTPWLRADILQRNAEVLARGSGLIKCWRGCVSEAVEARADELLRSLPCAPEMLLKRLGVVIRVTRSMDRPEMSSASVDLFYSDSVFQFMEPRDLAALVREARRFLKPSGRCLHVVDCSDSHAGNDARIPRLAYLRWPEPVWNLLTSRYLNYQNRWRMPRFVALFDREGFQVRTLDPVAHPEDVAYVKRHFVGASHLAGASLEDIATSRFLLAGRVREG